MHKFHPSLSHIRPQVGEQVSSSLICSLSSPSSLRLLLTPEEARSAKRGSQPQNHPNHHHKRPMNHTRDEFNSLGIKIWEEAQILRSLRSVGDGESGGLGWSSTTSEMIYKDLNTMLAFFSSSALTSSDSYFIHTHLIPFHSNNLFFRLNLHQLQYEIHNRLQHRALERSSSSCCTHQQPVSLI